MTIKPSLRDFPKKSYTTKYIDDVEDWREAFVQALQKRRKALLEKDLQDHISIKEILGES